MCIRDRHTGVVKISYEPDFSSLRKAKPRIGSNNTVSLCSNVKQNILKKAVSCGKNVIVKVLITTSLCCINVIANALAIISSEPF